MAVLIGKNDVPCLHSILSAKPQHGSENRVPSFPTVWSTHIHQDPYGDACVYMDIWLSDRWCLVVSFLLMLLFYLRRSSEVVFYHIHICIWLYLHLSMHIHAHTTYIYIHTITYYIYICINTQALHILCISIYLSIYLSFLSIYIYIFTYVWMIPNQPSSLTEDTPTLQEPQGCGRPWVHHEISQRPLLLGGKYIA